MAKGINNRTRLSINSTDPDAQTKELQRWANGLPFGAFGFSVVQVANPQTINAGLKAKIFFDTALKDNERWKIVGLQTDFTVPPGGSGIYVISAALLWAAAQVGIYVSIQVNNLAIVQTVDGAAMDRCDLTTVYPLNDGDIVSVILVNASAANVTISIIAQTDAIPRRPSFSAWRISLL